MFVFVFVFCGSLFLFFSSLDRIPLTGVCLIMEDECKNIRYQELLYTGCSEHYSICANLSIRKHGSYLIDGQGRGIT